MVVPASKWGSIDIPPTGSEPEIMEVMHSPTVVNTHTPTIPEANAIRVIHPIVMHPWAVDDRPIPVVVDVVYGDVVDVHPTRAIVDDVVIVLEDVVVNVRIDNRPSRRWTHYRSIDINWWLTRTCSGQSRSG